MRQKLNCQNISNAILIARVLPYTVASQNLFSKRITLEFFPLIFDYSKKQNQKLCVIICTKQFFLEIDDLFYTSTK